MRTLLRRIQAFNSAKVSSIELKSGEYGGRYSNITSASSHSVVKSWIINVDQINIKRRHSYLKMMNWCVIHDNYRSGTWIRRSQRNDFRTHEFDEQFLGSAFLNDVPSQKAICAINWKNRPPFWAFDRSIFMGRYSDRCSTVFSVSSALICCRFIKEKQLWCCVSCQLVYSCIPEFWITFCSPLLHLQLARPKLRVRTRKVPFSLSNACDEGYDGL